MSATHCDQCGGPFSSAHSDPNLHIQIAAKDAEIARLRAALSGLADQLAEEASQIRHHVLVVAQNINPTCSYPVCTCPKEKADRCRNSPPARVALEMSGGRSSET